LWTRVPEGFYQANTGMEDWQSEGQRIITLKRDATDCGGATRVTYNIAGSVSLTGHLNANNQRPFPNGDTEHQCHGFVNLNGLASSGKEGSVVGPFTLVEGSETVTLGTSALNVAIPIPVDDQCDISGTDTVNAMNTVTVGDGAAIGWFGVANSYSKAHDGAEEASGMISLTRSQFSLTINGGGN
jgi:hypothetical protein